ncbi:MAG TPA: ABC transporter permease [Candidatus Polarisedimenticolaceae bacterium]|nr:ABC transporter permease [Candidatus Polarisedimenticolaceae bacterium]
MSAVVAVVKRELQAYFVSPVAYAFMAVFLFIIAAGFSVGFMRYVMIPAAVFEKWGLTIRTQLVAGQYGLVTWGYFAALFSLPGLSMRLLSEEKKLGTAELLFTSPITSAQIVVGKFFGAVTLYAFILFLTLPFPAFLAWKGEPELAALGAAYLGLFFYGAVMLAAGVFASSLTESQFIALILTYAIVMPLVLVEFAVPLVRPPFDQVVSALAIGYALKAAALGSIDTAYVILQTILIAAFLFLAVRVIDSPRWR